MTDRELLEYAAKAAGLPFQYWDGSVHWPHEGFTPLDSSGTPVSEYRWNPLNDGGDALRLAVKLKIDVFFHAYRVEGHVAGGRLPPVRAIEREDYNDDPYAATRRAIVRAAAEIGKEIK